MEDKSTYFINESLRNSITKSSSTIKWDNTILFEIIEDFKKYLVTKIKKYVIIDTMLKEL